MHPTANWYPDPSGLWERRWWDGTGWSEHVATGGWQSTEPVGSPVAPPVDEAQIIWSCSGVSENEPARLDLTWTTLDFVPLRRAHETRRWPLGFIVGVTTERESPDGSGNLRVRIRGQGYVGPSTVVLQKSEHVHYSRAVILRQRAIITGLPASTPPPA